MKIITLLSDFGSFYPAQMKGVILGRLQEKARRLNVCRHRSRHPAPGCACRCLRSALHGPIFSKRHYPHCSSRSRRGNGGAGAGDREWRPDLHRTGQRPAPARGALAGDAIGLQDHRPICGLQHLPRPGCIRACCGAPGCWPEPGKHRPKGPAQGPLLWRSEEDEQGN